MLNFFSSLAKSSASTNNTPVIILIGQSNAGGEQYNIPEFEQLPEQLRGNLSGVYRIFKYDNVVNHDDFAVVNDTDSNRIGLDLNLGYLYQKYHKKEVYIIKYAYGATALSQQAATNWNVNTNNSLFDGLKDCVTVALNKLISQGLVPDVKAIVWYQGEEDGYQGQSQAEYRNNEKSFFNGLRNDLDLPSVKIYSVKINTKSGVDGSWNKINAAKTDNELELQNYKTVNSDGLQWSNTYTIHLNKAGQIELGRRVFELLKYN